jgi:hypothetical protein
VTEQITVVINAKDNASKAIGGISSAFGGMAKVAGGILAAGVIQNIGRDVINFGKDSIGAASDLRETWNKVNTIFGDGAGELKDFVDEWGTQLGQSQQQMLDAASTFGVFGKSAGLSGNDLANFSGDLVELSSDLASFYNSSPEEAIEAIGAALRGESEPIRKYGVLLDDASLRQKALAMGLIKTTKNALTPQQRVLAAQALIFDQTADAQGDFVKTSDGLANSQRIIAAQWKDIQTQVGSAFLPLIENLAGALSKLFADPAFQAGLQSFITGLAGVVATVMDNFPRVVEWIEKALGWFGDNQGVLVGALTAIGATILSFVVPPLVAMVIAALPVIAIMAAIGVAAYLLYQAWTNNFGGIQEKTAAAWAWLQPILQKAWDWLQINLPLALAWLSNVWTTVLLPAIQTVWAWIQGTLFPFLQVLWNWLALNVPAALATLADFWTFTLLPAITAVWEWMSTTLFPFLKEIADFLTAVFQLAVQELSKAWQEKLLPALQEVWKFINEKVFPLFKEVGDWLKTSLGPILETAGGIVRSALGAAFEWAAEKVSGLRQTLRDLTDWINVLLGKSDKIANNASYTPKPGGLATGGWGAKGSWSLVGERGPELVRFPNDGYVFNAGQTSSMLAGAGGGDTYILNANYGYQSPADTAADLKMLELLHR